jgi:hypothetical protein
LAQTFIDLDEELNLTVLASELFHYMPFVLRRAASRHCAVHKTPN